MKKSKIKNFSDEKIIEILNRCSSISEFMKEIGYLFVRGGGNRRTVFNYLKERNILIPNYKKIQEKLPFYNKRIITNDDMFSENSKCDRKNVKNRILKDKLLNYKCEKCENTGFWMNTEITLQLDHINGIFNDNRLINLRFLCPNCHSQTSTHCVGNKKEKSNKCVDCNLFINKTNLRCKKCSDIIKRLISRPTLEQLLIDVEHNGYVGTGRKYGVSNTTIKKWIKQYKEKI